MESVRRVDGIKMSNEMVVLVEVKGSDNAWKLLSLYDNNGEEVDIFSLECPSILIGDSKIATRRGLPESFSAPDRYSGSAGSTWYDYHELRAYSKLRLVDVMNDDDIYERYHSYLEALLDMNPLVTFVAKVEAILEAYEVYCPNPGSVRVVCIASY